MYLSPKKGERWAALGELSRSPKVHYNEFKSVGEINHMDRAATVQSRGKWVLGRMSCGVGVQETGSGLRKKLPK
jgi:hypothetical protein